MNKSENFFYNSFVYSPFFNSFVLKGNNPNILVIDADTFKLREKFTISNNINFKEFKGLDISYDGIKIILSSDNKFIYRNLLTHEHKILNFQKNITKIKYLDNDSIVIGDTSGKLHFIDDITGKVTYHH